MQEEKYHIGERGPEPADFDEEDVEEVLFLRKVGGRELRRVGLRRGAVGSGAGVGLKEGEEGAEKEGTGEDGKKEEFEGSGEDGGGR